MDSYNHQGHWPEWGYAGGSESYASYQHQISQYPSFLSESMEAAYRSQQQHLAHHQQVSRITESKPRLSKDEVDILEAEFQKNHKPSTNVKKALAESMRVENARINNWFQNRRAREKKERNIREYEAKQLLEKERAEASGCPRSDIPRVRDLVASTAPFPGPASNSHQGTSEDESCSMPTDNESDGTGQSPSLSHVEASQPKPSMGYFDVANITPISPDMDMMSDAQHNGYFSLSHSQKNEADRTPDQIPGLEYDLSDSASDAQLGSPASNDMVGRRDQRPSLLMAGSKSFSSTMPKSTQDVYRRPDLANLHRISSAGHAARTSKVMSAPRSPFHDRRADGLLYLNRSPGTTVSSDSTTPETPGTPLINQAGSGDYMIKYPCNDIPAQATDMGTPPRTPSVGVPVHYGSPVTGYDGSSITATAAARYATSLALNTSQVRPPAIGTNFQYNWSDVSQSKNSSSGRIHENSFGATATPAYGC